MAVPPENISGPVARGLPYPVSWIMLFIPFAGIIKREKGESVTSFKGSKQKYNCESRILIATISKAGVGFDHPKMDALILASDVEEYFIQYLGRVFRREDVHPVVFDIVDNFNSLKRHYYTRKKVYDESGGTILKFNKENITNFTTNFNNFNNFF